jgi:gamma-glutamyl:cysteine ligase YbdK (ATP-grasp superfamily)
MNEEITIEQQLQAELSRLKKAIEYIEQAEKNVQTLQQLNKENLSKYEEILKSNDNLKSDINAQISSINKRLVQIIDDLNKLSNIGYSGDVDPSFR